MRVSLPPRFSAWSARGASAGLDILKLGGGWDREVDRSCHPWRMIHAPSRGELPLEPFPGSQNRAGERSSGKDILVCIGLIILIRFRQTCFSLYGSSRSSETMQGDPQRFMYAPNAGPV